MQAREISRRLPLWDPGLNHSDRFIVGHGTAINLYRWIPKTGEIRMITSHPTYTPFDTSSLKCLAWSPHPSYDDLIATASQSGKVHILRLNAAMGSSPGSSNTLSAPSMLSLPFQTGRPVHALAFSSYNPNYLALGMERIRGESGFILVDVEASAKALPSSHLYPDNSPASGATKSTPIRPKVSEGRDSRVVYTYGLRESVNSVAFLPGSSTTLIAGITMRALMIIDTRLSSPAGAQQIQHRACLGLCTDPWDETKFASFGEDGGVRLWDRRYFTVSPLLTFTGADASADGGRAGSISSIAFSPSRRGILASLGVDAGTVRLWNFVGGYDIGDDMHGAGELKSGTVAPPRGPPKFVEDRPYASGDYLMPSLIHTRQARSQRTLMSFCFSQNLATLEKRTNILTVSREGDLEICRIHDSLQHTWSPRGDMPVSYLGDIKIHRNDISGEPQNTPAPWDIVIEDSESALGSHSQNKPTAQDETRPGRSPSAQRLHDIEFPPLPRPSAGSSLTATRPRKSQRTFSPSSLRRSLPNRSGPENRGTPDGPSPRGSPKLKGRGLSNAEQDKAQNTKREGRKRFPALKGRSSYPSTPQESDSGVQSEVDDDPDFSSHGVPGMKDDISLVMKNRVLAGYGMENATHNAKVVQNDPVNGDRLEYAWVSLSRLMKTLHDDRSHNVNGFDFSYQGLLGIWDGLASSYSTESRLVHAIDTAAPINERLQDDAQVSPQYSQPYGRRSAELPRRDSSIPEMSGHVIGYDATLEILNSIRRSRANRESGIGMGYPEIDIPTNKLQRRKLGLALCDWDLTKDGFVNEITNWVHRGENTRAACWAVLIKDYDGAIDHLIRSKDERHRIISTTISAIVSQRAQDSDSPNSNPWREQCQRLAVWLEDPYLRILLLHLIQESWADILQDEAIPLHDRLGIIFRFVEDEKVSACLHDVLRTLIGSGNLQGLLLTGITTKGIDLLQAYVDQSGDIQTAAILSSYVSPARFKDERVERWVEAYQDLLDQWGLFYFRCQFDIERGRMLQQMIVNGETAPFEWVPRHLLIRCNYCNKIVNTQQPLTEAGVSGLGASPAGERVHINYCPSCKKTLPRCAICLMTLGISNDAARDTELMFEPTSKDTLDDALVFCQTCRHGGHANHIIDWFYSTGTQVHTTCPVADCDCRCADL
ncbi:hypothetical protein FRC02_002535 [Tulasnella sp. 418]|nr:hypothetical protein FRC02_002535 [Tulasnella sp. 418]